MNYYINARQQHGEQCWLQSRDNSYPPHCREGPEGTAALLQNCNHTAVFQSRPTGREAHSTVCSWVWGKIRPCFKRDLLKEKENGIEVIFRHRPKLHTGFYLEIAYRFLLRKLPFSFFFFFPLSLFLELSLVLRKTETIQARGDHGGGLLEVDSKCSLA